MISIKNMAQISHEFFVIGAFVDLMRVVLLSLRGRSRYTAAFGLA